MGQTDFPYVIEQADPRVVTIRMEVDSPDWSQFFLLRSDAHHDNVHCDQKLEKEHLEQALQRNAGIIDVGDMFCAMQGRFDKRADMNQFRPELRVPNYLDALVAYNASFYEPYAKQFAIITPGNHEEAIERNHQTRLSERLAERLRAKGSSVKLGTYQGWCRFMFKYQKTQQSSYRLRWHHGAGGGSPVTKGIIAFSRQLMYLDDVDILITGHIHTSLQMIQAREYLDKNGMPQIRNITCLRTGTYKNEFSSGEGWAVTKEFGPSPLGSWWLKFLFKNNRIAYEITRAD